jgi:hypothetical protein
MQILHTPLPLDAGTSVPPCSSQKMSQDVAGGLGCHAESFPRLARKPR